MVYSQLAGGALYSLMAREFAPLPDRLRAATSRMEKLPGLFEQMQANLDPARVPKIHAETVSKQNKGVLSLVDGLIAPHAKELPDAERKRLEAAIAGLRKAVAQNQTWIDRKLVPKAKGDFRIGADLYDAKLAFALNSPLTRADIRQRAEAALKSTREEMYGIARKVLAGKRKAPPLPENPTPAQQQKAIQAALELAYADRPKRDQVIATAEAALQRATEFVRAKDIVGLPDAPLKIIPMPEFQRGVALAYCDSPGPLDKNLDTFYAVSPIPKDWTKKQVDSFLREYNTRSIEELTIHEAMPGHYLQLWHSNKYPSVLRAVLSSGPFIEGLGGVHREAHGRRRLSRRRPAVPPRAPEVGPACDRQRDPRPGDPRRRHDAQGRDEADDGADLPGGTRGGRQVDARAADLGAAADLLRRLAGTPGPVRRRQAALGRRLRAAPLQRHRAVVRLAAGALRAR